LEKFYVEYNIDVQIVRSPYHGLTVGTTLVMFQYGND